MKTKRTVSVKIDIRDLISRYAHQIRFECDDAQSVARDRIISMMTELFGFKKLTERSFVRIVCETEFSKPSVKTKASEDEYAFYPAACSMHYSAKVVCAEVLEGVMTDARFLRMKPGMKAALGFVKYDWRLWRDAGGRQTERLHKCNIKFSGLLTDSNNRTQVSDHNEFSESKAAELLYGLQARVFWAAAGCVVGKSIDAISFDRVIPMPYVQPKKPINWLECDDNWLD